MSDHPGRIEAEQHNSLYMCMHWASTELPTGEKINIAQGGAVILFDIKTTDGKTDRWKVSLESLLNAVLEIRAAKNQQGAPNAGSQVSGAA